MREIQLNKGYVSVVDDEDYDALSAFKWASIKTKITEIVYARRWGWIGGKVVSISMHTAIMLPPKGMMVDHIDGDGLNNRRENLRICSHTQNMQNRTRWSGNTAGYKGVRLDGRKFKAVCKAYNKIYYGPYRVTAVEAAKDYDDLAIKHHKEFASTNARLGLI